MGTAPTMTNATSTQSKTSSTTRHQGTAVADGTAARISRTLA